MDTERTRAGFDRYLSPTDVWAIAFGCIVGWGAFVMPGTTFLPVAGPFGTLIAMAVSIAIMLVIGANFTFLMTRRPGTGGVYAYTKEAFGRDHAFICSWFLCLSYLTIVFLNGTSLFIVVRTLFDALLQVGPRYVIAGNDVYLGEVGLSVLALAAVGLLFLRAKPFLQRLHTVLSIVLLAGSLLVAAVCLPRLRLEHVAGAFGLGSFDPAYVVFTIVLLAPWAFVGFDVISMETAHFAFPVRRSGRIISLSILLSGVVYAAMCFVAICAVPEGFAGWEEYIAGLDGMTGVASVPTFYAVRAIMGTPGLVIMGVTALAAILTGMIGAYRATARVLSTMAEDRILSDRFQNTAYSIVFIMLISILISFLGRNALNWFVELTSFGAIVGFAYTSAASWKLARIEGNRRVLVTSALGTAITAAFGIVQLVPSLTAVDAMGAASFLMLAVWCLLGFVLYWHTVDRTPLSEYSGISTSGSVLFALLLYSVSMWIAKRLAAAESTEAVRAILAREGVVFLLIVFVGFLVMLYIQKLVRRKHEQLEREKIHAVESSLAKSRFLFNMSHDIRTPMNAIIGYTELAKGEEELPAVRGYLGKIESASRRLLALINDILEMSRIESGTRELVFSPEDLREIFRDTGDLFREQMREKEIDFSVYTGHVRDPWVWCDRQSLDRVLLNLVSNALKFTPRGGSISAALWEVGSGEGGYGSYELRIRDSGIGMSKEFSEKMFNAFERERTSTVSKTEGAGLGLAITKSLVDLMDGTIEVITSPGSGTEFIIRLKLRLATQEEAAAASGGNADGKPRQADFTGKRLLLAEDNEINREIANMILGQAGFTVENAPDGKAALDMVAASMPGYYDAVLMDIQMPVMDGYEATRAIRALADPGLASVPVVAMTANAFREDQLAAAEAGMQAHIAKPLDIDRMLATLAEVLGAK